MTDKMAWIFRVEQLWWWSTSTPNWRPIGQYKGGFANKLTDNQTNKILQFNNMDIGININMLMNNERYLVWSIVISLWISEWYIILYTLNKCHLWHKKKWNKVCMCVDLVLHLYPIWGRGEAFLGGGGHCIIV